MAHHLGERERRLADEGDLLARVAGDAGGDGADLLDGRSAPGLGIEVLRKPLGVELTQERVEARLQVLDRDLAARTLAQEIDEQRDAGAVAIVDGTRVDDDALRRRLAHRMRGALPEVTDRAGVEPARQRENASIVGVGNGELGHVARLPATRLRHAMHGEMRGRRHGARV